MSTFKRGIFELNYIKRCNQAQHLFFTQTLTSSPEDGNIFVGILPELPMGSRSCDRILWTNASGAKRSPAVKEIVMQPLQRQGWILPSPCTVEEFQTSLAQTFALNQSLVKKTKRSWFDTTDWRLYRKKKLLFHDGSQWILQNFKGRTLKNLASRRKSYATFWQFPDSPLRNALQGLLDIRALIELTTEYLLSTELQILNSDEKIVCILEIKQSSCCHNDKQFLTVQQSEVRGYTKKFKQVASFIRDVGGVKQNGSVDTFHHLLEGSGRTPLDYSSAYNVPLEPLMSSREALRRIYSSLLADIQVNIQGVLNDIDTESLHDLRVAVRRTRSGLVLIKNVLNPEVSERFKKEFRDMGQITGPVRDLDVCLLSEESYKARLPEYLQEGLTYFFEDIAAKRKEEQRRLAYALRRPHFVQVLTEWGHALEFDDTYPAGENAGVSITTLAGTIVRKRFRMVIRDGRKIQPDTPVSELHRLRIECKKLRYSLEFFSSLYDQQRVENFIKQLKKLQNNLGDFNDLSVQQDMLANYLAHIKPGSRKSMQLAASIGGLMSDLFRQHQDVRTHFEETFSRFSSNDNLLLYGEIFGK